jgi:hypothetical protein
MSNPSHSGRIALTAAGVLCLLAALSALALIVANGVNVPFADEWWYSSLVQKVRLGEATIETFWSPNNEHRMLVPKMEFAVLALLTHWNSKMMMIFQWVVMAIAGTLLFVEFRKIFPPSRPILWACTVSTALAVFFSGVQHENWLWAFQFAFFFIQTCVIVSVFSVSRSTGPFWLRTVIAMLLAVAASVSSAQGLLIWPTLLVAMALNSESKERKIAGSIFVIALMTCIAWVYFRDLTIASDDRLRLPLRELLTKPKVVVHGFFGLVGSPLVYWAPHNSRLALAWPVGLIITAIFVWLVIRLVRDDRSRAEAGPWIALGFYACCFCLVTVYGRLGGGYNLYFLTSRYTTHPALMTVAVLALGLIALDSKDRSHEVALGGRPAGVKTVFGLTLVLLALAVADDIGAFRRSSIDAVSRSFAKSLVPFYGYFDRAVDGVQTGPFYPLCPLKGKGIFQVGLEPLCRDGYFDQIKNSRFVEVQADETGSYQMSGASKGHDPSEMIWDFAGRVSVPPNTIADTLFIRPAGGTAFVTATQLKPVGMNGDRQYAWRVLLSSSILQDPKTPLELWVYDRPANAFRRVNAF